jgi:hypothetical protein
MQFRVNRCWGQGLLATVGWLALAGLAQGQEALRFSMAGDLAAATQQQATTTLGYYNLLLGPTAWRFSSALGMEYNDNVYLQENGEGDFIIRPSLNTMMHWPVSLKNSVDLSINAGYSEYVQHSDLSQFFIRPGSGLSFDIYAGDFKINLHDWVGISEYGYENPGVRTGNENLTSLQNTVGTSGLWNLNKASVNVGYDHADYVSLSTGSQDQLPDVTSENVFVNGGIRVRPELMLGVEAGGTIIEYSQSSQANTALSPNAVQASAGVFGTAKISDNMDVRLDGGYTEYTPDHTVTNLLTSDTSGFYLSLSFTHRVNRFLSYSLTAGHSTDLAAYGQAQSYYYVRLNPTWKFFEKYTINTPISWQDGTLIYNSAAFGSTDYQQIRVGANVTRTLTKKLSATLGYQFVRETSNQSYNQSGLNYTENIVDLNLSYQF